MIYEELNIAYTAGTTKRIEYFVDKNGCWICTSHTKDKDGYYKICRNRKHARLHRYIYEQEKGKIPTGLVIRHKCDNPQCINPFHLECGTHRDNSRDKVIRHRQASGERNGTSVLTDEKVLDIRRDNRPYRAIAKDYGVAFNTIAIIKRGDAWTHLDMSNCKRYGSRNNPKLTDEDVILIRELALSGLEASHIAEKFDVSRDYIYSIISHKARVCSNVGSTGK